MSNSRSTPFTRVVLLTALYFLGGLLGKQASFLSGTMALVWPPSDFGSLICEFEATSSSPTP